MKKNNNIARFYDKQSIKYDQDRFKGNPLYYRLLNDVDLATLAPYVKNKKVLEVGCGTGIIAKEISRNCKEVVGIDISQSMLKIAKSKGLKVTLGSAEKIPFPNDSFDTTYSFKVLSHVINIKKGLQEIARVTKKDGTMLLEFYNKHSVKKIAHTIAGYDIHTRFDSLNEIKTYLPENTEIIRIEGTRIISLHAGVYKIPIIKHIFYFLELVLAKTPLKYFSSYLIVIIKFKN